jgi:hypothetical protein
MGQAGEQASQSSIPEPPSCAARALLPLPAQRVPAAPHQGALAAVGPRTNAATRFPVLVLDPRHRDVAASRSPDDSRPSTAKPGELPRGHVPAH